LEAVNYQMNSDRFIFDQEIMAQFVCVGLRIAEVPVPTRYFPQASSASFWQSSVYGLSILFLLARYNFHRWGILKQPQFESLQRRYQPEAARKGGTVPSIPDSQRDLPMVCDGERRPQEDRN
jgi:hypothetical protein